MDQLNNENGFTLIEILVSMVILGILVTLTVLFINTFFSNPVTLFRAEALNVAKVEINYACEFKRDNDSSYTAGNGNLLVERKIMIEEKVTEVFVSVIHKPTEKLLVELNKIYRNK